MSSNQPTQPPKEDVCDKVCLSLHSNAFHII